MFLKKHHQATQLPDTFLRESPLAFATMVLSTWIFLFLHKLADRRLQAGLAFEVLWVMRTKCAPNIRNFTASLPAHSCAKHVFSFKPCTSSAALLDSPAPSTAQVELLIEKPQLHSEKSNRGLHIRSWLTELIFGLINGLMVLQVGQPCRAAREHAQVIAQQLVVPHDVCTVHLKASDSRHHRIRCNRL